MNPEIFHVENEINFIFSISDQKWRKIEISCKFQTKIGVILRIGSAILKQIQNKVSENL